MKSDDIKRLCAEYGIVPSKSKGQNFLLDESYCDSMVQVARLTPDDVVVEIGPGFGVLTEKLIATGARVIAVELDKKLIPYLENRFKDSMNFKLIEGDILRMTKSGELWGIVGGDAPGGRLYTVVANLPYAITSPILKVFLTAEHKPQQMVVMVQKEVAERICAQPGEMSLLALSVQYYADVRIVEQVPRTVFLPIPEVASAIICIDVATKNNPPLPEADPPLAEAGRQKTRDEQQVFQLARMAFAGKRKQLKNSLANGLHCTIAEAVALLESAGINPFIRPQELGVGDWTKIAEEQEIRSKG